jgi:hypothetical protein
MTGWITAVKCVVHSGIASATSGHLTNPHKARGSYPIPETLNQPSRRDPTSPQSSYKTDKATEYDKTNSPQSILQQSRTTTRLLPAPFKVVGGTQLNIEPSSGSLIHVALTPAAAMCHTHTGMQLPLDSGRKLRRGGAHLLNFPQPGLSPISNITNKSF